ncbi:MAG: CpaF family protein, partial [Anaerolineae bacterium]|nr:CpaF family protein [Anaerolineae bacterium]
VVARINAEFSPDQVLTPDDDARQQIVERIRHWTQGELRQRGFGAVDLRVEADLAQRIQHQMLGLGFLEPLLGRDDVSEIMLNQDGSLWLMRKGQVNPTPVADVLPDTTRPGVTEVRIVIDKLLGQVGRRVSEAEPIVAAKLPRSPRLPAGARVNVVIPPIANGPYPEMNVRLYEPKPVPVEQLLAWGEMDEEIAGFLRNCVLHQLRIVVAGGTATGKTTLLSCLVGFIPPEQRIVFVEDPAELFVEHPHVVSLEARPPTTEGKYGVRVGDLVTTAMRMSPRWLVVGEVRHGDAAVWLMRAQMSDHPGMSTVHADDPKSAVETLCLLAMIDNDPPVRAQATKTLIARSIDLFVQISIDPWGVRRVTRIGQVAPELKAGEVWIDDLYLYQAERSTRERPVWDKVGELTRKRTMVGERKP